MIYALIKNNFEGCFGDLIKGIMGMFCIYIGSRISLSRYEDIKKDKIRDVLVCSNKYAFTIPIFLCFYQGLLFGKVSTKSSQSMHMYIVCTICTAVCVILLKSNLNSFLKYCGWQSVQNYQIKLVEYIPKGEEESIHLIDISYKKSDLFGLLVAGLIGAWYQASNYWIPNNILAMSISIWAIPYIYTNKVVTASILLVGLLCYDVIAVYGTNIMKTLVQEVTAPTLLYFPRDFFTSGFFSNNIGYLGLADVIYPGIFMSLLMRFDFRTGSKNSTYFKAGCVGYIFGNIMCSLAIRAYGGQHPALLYINPFCLLFPIIYSAKLKEFKKLIKYEDFPKEEDANMS